MALDTPSRQSGIYISGGVMAAPTVGAVIADILPYLGEKPQFSPDETAGRICVLEDFTGLSREEAEKRLKEKELTVRFEGTGTCVQAQIPGAGQEIPGGSQVVLYMDGPPEKRLVKVPDFTGLNRQQAGDLAGSLGLYVLVSGNPEISPRVVAAAQSEPEDAEVPAGTTIRLEFADQNAAD